MKSVTTAKSINTQLNEVPAGRKGNPIYFPTSLNLLDCKKVANSPLKQRESFKEKSIMTL